VWVNAGFVGGMHVVGKIAFNPKEVLGRGSEGTFVYRFVQHMTHRLNFCLCLYEAMWDVKMMPIGRDTPCMGMFD